MTSGQVTKYLKENDDGVYVAIANLGESIVVSDKLYAHQGTALANRPGRRVVKITKEMFEYLDREQNGGEKK